jgi:hypothetical protein
MSLPYPENPFAPLAFAGITPPPDTSFDRTFAYLYNFTLTGLQVGVSAQVAIDTDADFLMEAMYVSVASAAFLVQLSDSTGYELQSGQLQSAAISTSSANPTVISPMHRFPAGGKIQILITNLSGLSNTGQIVFLGVKRYLLPLNEGALL